jgi:hypothetical protein
MSHIFVAEVMEVVSIIVNGSSLQGWTYGTAWKKPWFISPRV